MFKFPLLYAEVNQQQMQDCLLLMSEAIVLTSAKTVLVAAMDKGAMPFVNHPACTCGCVENCAEAARAVDGPAVLPHLAPLLTVYV
jgi:hypothetical protein